MSASVICPRKLAFLEKRFPSDPTSLTQTTSLRSCCAGLRYLEFLKQSKSRVFKWDGGGDEIGICDGECDGDGLLYL